MAKLKGETKGSSTKSRENARTTLSSENLPRRTLHEALTVAQVLHETFGALGASWDEIAGVLGVTASNPNNKYPLWSAVAYNIVKKDDDGTFSLAELGRKIVAPNYDGEDREAKVRAIQVPAILGRFYADYDGSLIPADEHFLNLLENRYGVPRDRRSEAAQVLLDNAKFAGILEEAEGGRRSVRINGAKSQLHSIGSDPTSLEGLAGADERPAAYDRICFIITPIADEHDEERRHADMILKHLIRPVLEEQGLEVVRADQISKPGLITQQIVEHLAYAKLCVADLSFGNENAFYEIGVRHVIGLPTVQIIRKGDKIPFDVSQGRTIIIDTADRYTIMDRFESARNELREHVKATLSAGKGLQDNPIQYYLPGLRVTVPPRE